jgi:DNA-binding GntR family transcriptional regulator
VTIDHLGQSPLYKQLAGILRGMIERSELEPGQPLPSEAYLQQEHGISRGTVRMAIGLLRDEGLVITLSGRGTYVRRQQ